MSIHCQEFGHVWREGPRPRSKKTPHGPLYARNRTRSEDSIAVYCEHCPAKHTLPTFAKHTAPPLLGSVPKSP